MTEVRRQRTEGGRQKTEDGRQIKEGERLRRWEGEIKPAQMTEMAEVGSGNAEGGIKKHEVESKGLRTG
jgi:hypothetical protein